MGSHGGPRGHGLPSAGYGREDVLYNAAGQITQMKYLRTGSAYYTETRQCFSR